MPGKAKTFRNAAGANRSRREALKHLAALGAGIFVAGLPVKIKAAGEETKMLIIYFSHTGHTRTVGKEIQALTHADMVEIKPVIPFPADHDECVRVAEKEAAENFRPEFTADMPANLGAYGVIFLGFPIWAYTMPMIVYSFLDKYHFAGKKIAPFSTHMGSGLADAPEQIARLCPQAEVLRGLAIRGSNADHSSADVKEWLLGLGLIK